MNHRFQTWARRARAGSAAATLLALGAVDPLSAAGFVGVRAAAHDLPSPVASTAGLAAADATAATVTAARIEATGSESARLVFDLSAGAVPKDVVSRAFVMAGPDRAVIDLPAVDFALDPAVGRARVGRHARKGLVQSFRFGLLAPGRSRIVIDLAQPARLVGAAVRTSGGKASLVVDLAKTDRAAFAASARAPAPVASTPVSAPVTAAADKATIVLDPGHGGPDNGAMVNGVVEKDVTLAFARLLAGKLEASGRFNVVMSRSSDVFIPLSERVRIARSSGAALMISIHADTLPESTDVSGATVYTVSDRASDAYAAKVAAKENEADAAVGVDGQADVADVNDILFDLTRQETRAYSHVFARTLVNYWSVAGRLNKNPQRAAGFVVLKAPDVPSVLLELGYLSSASDAASLTSADWREKATTRMAEAVTAYFADRRGPAKAAAGVPIPAPQAFAALPEPR